MVRRYFEADDLPEEVALLADGVALPRSALRLSPELREVLSDIQRGSLFLARIEADLDHLTREARELGASWSVLGFVNGLTGEAVRRRLRDDDYSR